MSKILLKALSVAAWLTAVGPMPAATAASVDPPSLPTEVEVAVLVVDVVEIDGARQSMSADLFFRLRWLDPRLAEAGGGNRRLSLDEVWHPRMLVANRRSAEEKLPEVVEVDADGRVTYRQRLVGDFACPLDLADFPFDSQTLGIQAVSVGHTPEQIKFVINHGESGRAGRFSITDWEVGEPLLVERSYTVPYSDREFPGVALQFEVNRLARYYSGTIFATVGIIAVMAWLVFWIPPSYITPRISISVTSMLSLIAYRFVADRDLPRLPYLTRMDFFLLGATLMVLLGLVAVVLISRRQSHGHEESALRWNSILGWSYPLVFTALMSAVLFG